MLAAFVGEDTFLKGVSIYLKQRLYGNSVTKDLWDGISEAVKDTSGLNVAQFMENWTSKVERFRSNALHTLMQSRLGSPSSKLPRLLQGLLFARIVSSRQTTSNPRKMRPSGELTSSDSRIHLIPTSRNIPLSIFSVDGSGKGSINRSAVLDTREASFELDTSKPFKVNAGTTGVCE